MSAYTVSHLIHDAGVSVHVVRDYLLRGLLRPVACTTGGYGLVVLARLCRALELHYQPIVALRSGEIAGAEALLR